MHLFISYLLRAYLLGPKVKKFVFCNVGDENLRMFLNILSNVTLELHIYKEIKIDPIGVL